MVKFNLSPSSLNSYLESPLVFYYTYIEKKEPDTDVPTCYSLAGNLVHHILENKLSANKVFWGLLEQKNLNKLRGFNFKPLNGNDYYHAAVRGTDLMKTKYDVLRCEEKIVFGYSKNIKIKGFIDVIALLKQNGELVIEDWKTSSRIDVSDNFRRQALFYVTLFYKKYNVLPTKVIFEYLKIGQEKEYSFSLKEVEDFWLYIHSIIKEIEEKGTDINNYAIGDIKSGFNEYKQACHIEQDRRNPKPKKVDNTIYPEVIDSGDIILRPYQKEAIAKGVHFLKNDKTKKNGIIIIPTAGGKSLVIAKMAEMLSVNDDEVLIFQPSKELLEQNYEKFINYGGIAAIYSASKNTKEIGQVTYATIGSVKNNYNLFKNVKYVICDEGHLINPRRNNEKKGIIASMYRHFFGNLKLKIICVTATPVRLKSYSFPEIYSKLNMLNRMTPRIFSEILHVTQIKDLYNEGYLTPLKYIDVDFERNQLEVNTTGADYTSKSLEKQFKRQKLKEKIIKACQDHKGRKHGLIFVSSIAEAEEISLAIKDCEMISSTTKKKDREELIKKFKNGEIKYIVNCGVLLTGFDYPEIDLVIMARPTSSLAVYYQSIGRGLRIHPNKKDCLVIDLVGNHKKFGDIKDLEIKDINGWGIYSKNKLLTGVPMMDD